MNISKLTKLSSLCALAIIGCYTINELHATGRNVKNCAANGDVMTATFSWFVNAEGGYVFASVEGGQTVTKTATGSCSEQQKEIDNAAGAGRHRVDAVNCALAYVPKPPGSPPWVTDAYVYCGLNGGILINPAE